MKTVFTWLKRAVLVLPILVYLILIFVSLYGLVIRVRKLRVDIL